MLNRKARKVAIFKNIESTIWMYYVCLTAVQLYKDTLKNEGFVFNSYKKCMANKIINGKHCTIQWYVDDNKVTHVSEGLITGVIDIMNIFLESWSCLVERNITFLALI